MGGKEGGGGQTHGKERVGGKEGGGGQTHGKERVGSKEGGGGQTHGWEVRREGGREEDRPTGRRGWEVRREDRPTIQRIITIDISALVPRVKITNLHCYCKHFVPCIG